MMKLNLTHFYTDEKLLNYFASKMIFCFLHYKVHIYTTEQIKIPFVAQFYKIVLLAPRVNQIVSKCLNS